MTLKPCLECGNPVSTGATACPHCAARNPTVGNRQIATRLAIVGGVVALIFAFSKSDSRPSVTPSPQPARDYQSDAYYACRDAVKGQLKAPSTADFFYQSDARVQKSGDTITFKSYVDAQNSFGAKLRNTWYCMTTIAGGQVRVLATEVR